MKVAIVAQSFSLQSEYGKFLEALAAAGFRGEISSRHGERAVLSTDNSIYQRMPEAAVYPRDADDVKTLARLLGEPRFRRITVAPRGGGTGTNGQSLTDGIVVDLSRHMNRIVGIDVNARSVRVEAGVVKDQLNAALAPHGLFFAPELSTSNRATIGGMVSTDASGQGSCTYGKTRDHVLALDVVLLGGESLHSEPIDGSQLERLCAQPGRIGKAYSTAASIAQEKAELIEACFPKLNRCLTGYDLAHLREPDGRFNLNSVLCGSEGSLGFIVEATLNVLPIPKFSILVNVRYASFMAALRDAHALMQYRPLSIETVDSKVLMLAMRDVVWQRVSEYFPSATGEETLGINLVEFSGDDESDVRSRVAAFTAHLQADPGVRRLGHTLAIGHEAVERVYGMRKRAVGLLGNVVGESRPQAFVEDTAVPPEHLADYIAEFRALLDQHGVAYGMFGHVDAGVLHVRPALDMKDPTQAARVRPISDGVVELTRKYGGLLWGEHGKGVRSEYVPAFFGELYPSLQALKAAFDPHNQLNPGKIATPLGSDAQLLRIDGVPTRGDADRQIDPSVWQSFGAAMHCNGNGACYNFSPDDLMCPSWKATRDRVHSPKGRASLVKEWLRLQGAAGVEVLELQRAEPPSFVGRLWRWVSSRSRKPGADQDFSHEVYDAMAGCLSCKSCASQCPVRVDIPDVRSRFLALYHTRYRRPLKDYLVGSLEYTIPYFARVPALYNGVVSSRPVRAFLERHAGMVDSPLLSRADWAATVRAWQVETATPELIERLTEAQRARSVILVQDAFTRYFETPLAASFVELAARLGYRVYLAPYLPNGKPLHVHGFMQAFSQVAGRHAVLLKGLARTGVAIVGLDPAMTLVYRQEYRKVPEIGELPAVMLPQEWLLAALTNYAPDVPAGQETAYGLLAHCTEKATVPESVSQWQQVFQKLGLRLRSLDSGCCGMSGTYGHETRNRGTSQVIFEQSWARLLEKNDGVMELLATGYSCRSQTERLGQRTLRHPVQVIVEHLRRSAPSRSHD